MKVKNLKNITSDELEKMTKQELKQTLAHAKKILANREKRLNEVGIQSHVFKNTPVKNLKTENQTRNSLLSSNVRALQMLQAETTTVTGAKKWQKKITYNITGEKGKILNQQQTDKVFEIYSKMQERYPNIKSNIDYKMILKSIEKRVSKNMSTDDILKKMDYTLKNELQKQNDYKISMQDMRDILTLSSEEMG